MENGMASDELHDHVHVLIEHVNTLQDHVLSVTNMEKELKKLVAQLDDEKKKVRELEQRIDPNATHSVEPKSSEESTTVPPIPNITESSAAVDADATSPNTNKEGKAQPSDRERIPITSALVIGDDEAAQKQEMLLRKIGVAEQDLEDLKVGKHLRRPSVAVNVEKKLMFNIELETLRKKEKRSEEEDDRMHVLEQDVWALDMMEKQVALMETEEEVRKKEIERTLKQEKKSRVILDVLMKGRIKPIVARLKDTLGYLRVRDQDSLEGMTEAGLRMCVVNTLLSDPNADEFKVRLLHSLGSSKDPNSANATIDVHVHERGTSRHAIVQVKYIRSGFVKALGEKEMPGVPMKPAKEGAVVTPRYGDDGKPKPNYHHPDWIKKMTKMCQKFNFSNADQVRVLRKQMIPETGEKMLMEQTLQGFMLRTVKEALLAKTLLKDDVDSDDFDCKLYAIFVIVDCIIVWKLENDVTEVADAEWTQRIF